MKLETFRDLFRATQTARSYPFRGKTWYWCESNHTDYHTGGTDNTGVISVKEIKANKIVEVYFHAIGEKLVLKGNPRAKLKSVKLFQFNVPFSIAEMKKPPHKQQVTFVHKEFGVDDPIPSAYMEVLLAVKPR